MCHTNGLPVETYRIKKQQFFISKQQTTQGLPETSDDEEDATSTFLCSMCESFVEEPSHFPHYKHPKLQAYQQDMRKHVSKALQKPNTYQGTIAVLLHVLRFGNTNTFQFIELYPTIGTLLNQVILSQSQITWKKFLHGIWYSDWHAVQKYHIDYLNITFDIDK